MKYWKRLSSKEQATIVNKALQKNVDFREKMILGVPASSLDEKLTNERIALFKDTPLLRAFAKNPNHIGCHTMGQSEPFFSGTQAIEQNLIETLCVDMFKAQPFECDGYVATGGTESNIQAVWIYRNYFMKEYGAKNAEIALLCSEDTHYCASKAANLLSIPLYRTAVDENTRMIIPELLDQTIQHAKEEGVKYVIVISNMATTMFGSVDDPELYATYLKRHGLPFMLHVDGAFGGFIYPVSNESSTLHFGNPYITSITLDAHKMLQAPYGTGIFLIRKGWIDQVLTPEASYVTGMDVTLSGSRSGANAIAIWMILYTYGPYGWLEKINKLLYRTDWLCEQLDKLNVAYYRHEKMNIVTIKSNFIHSELAQQYGLVPDAHTENPKWYKIVVMDHVELEDLKLFVEALSESLGHVL